MLATVERAQRWLNIRIWKMKLCAELPACVPITQVNVHAWHIFASFGVSCGVVDVLLLSVGVSAPCTPTIEAHGLKHKEW